jgi:hypothetical protein
VKLPKPLELLIAIALVTLAGACAVRRHDAACRMPVNEPTAGTEWCQQHPEVNCCLQKDSER